MMHPIYENLARKYTNVIFYKIDGDKNRNITQSQGITGFPTFKFYLNGNCVDSVVGADVNGLENKIIELSKNAAPPTFSGVGKTLSSGDGEHISADEMRRRRLERFNVKIDNNNELLNQLIEMGFSEEQSKEALEKTNNVGLEEAVEYISEHQIADESDTPVYFNL